MARIPFTDINLGGVADSKWMGIKNSMARMVGFDIHSLPGLIQVNQKMTKDSSTVVTEFCKVAIDCSNGIRYWFSADSGKIWQEKSGTYVLVYTTSPAVGSAVCGGAYEYQGYIYWATQNRLHRIPVVSADGASAWTANAVPNWATFTNGEATHHPMTEVNLVLYIGDKNFVAQVDAGVFSADAVDISSNYTITAMAKMGTNLIIGGSISGVNLSEIFTWNTYSVDSFQNSDTVPERGINSFLEADNYIFVNAGVSGSIYSYNGSQLEFYKRIPGVYTPTKRSIIYPNASAMWKGSIPIFGVSNALGNPCDQGIWSLGSHSRNYTKVFNLEFPVSSVDGSGYNLLSDIEIGAIIVSGVDIYMSWRLSGTGGQVDKLDYSNKIPKPFLETKIVAPDRTTLTSYGKFVVNYESLPTGTSFVIKSKIDYATNWSDTTEVVDTDRKQVYADADRLEAKNLQIRVEAVSSGNNSPTIDEIDIILP